MDKPAIEVCEAFAKAGYPLDVEALLIVEVEGSAEEISDLLARIVEIARRHNPMVVRISESEAQSAAIWKGRKSAFGAIGRIADYLLHGRHHPARRACRKCWCGSRRSASSTGSRSPTSSMPATAICIR